MNTGTVKEWELVLWSQISHYTDCTK